MPLPSSLDLCTPHASTARRTAWAGKCEGCAVASRRWGPAHGPAGTRGAGSDGTERPLPRQASTSHSRLSTSVETRAVAGPTSAPAQRPRVGKSWARGRTLVGCALVDGRGTLL